MEKPILTKEEIKWMMDNMKEVVSELRRKSDLVKNFYQELEIYRAFQSQESDAFDETNCSIPLVSTL